MTGFTLDGYALTGLFVVMFGFLAFSAWVFEQAEPDPISSDRRHQAHPFDAPSGRSTTEPVPPVPGSAGLDRPLGLSRGNQSVVPD